MKRIHVKLYTRYLAAMLSSEAGSTIEPEQIKSAYTAASQQFSFCYEPLNKYITHPGGRSHNGMQVDYVLVDSKIYSAVLAANPTT